MSVCEAVYTLAVQHESGQCAVQNYNYDTEHITTVMTILMLVS